MSRYIKPLPQEFDASGPIAQGQLFFYESGTNVLKDIFADSNETLPIANPVILDANGRVDNVFYSGTARVVLKKADNTQVYDVDPVGGSSDISNFNEWEASFLYSTGDFVQYQGDVYRSLTDNNIGNIPSDDPSTNVNWQLIELLTQWNTNVTYSENDLVVQNGMIYKSVVNGNQGNDPSLDSGASWQEFRAETLVEVAGAVELNLFVDNVLRDGSTFTLPSAASTEAGDWIDASQTDTDSINFTPIVETVGSDLISDSEKTDTTVTYDQVKFIKIRYISNGINRWEI